MLTQTSETQLTIIMSDINSNSHVASFVTDSAVPSWSDMVIERLFILLLFLLLLLTAAAAAPAAATTTTYYY